MFFDSQRNIRPPFVANGAVIPEHRLEASDRQTMRSEIETLQSAVNCLWLSLFAAFGLSLASQAEPCRAFVSSK
jgi:hypothetical protein